MFQNRPSRLLTLHAALLLLMVLLVMLNGSAAWLNEVSFVITGAQLSLLSIWMGLGVGSPTRRCALGLMGALGLVLVRSFILFYLSVWNPVLVYPGPGLLAEVAFNRIGRLVAVVFLLVAIVRPVFCIRKVSIDEEEARDPLQFGVRHLMVATLAAAVIVALGKEIHAFIAQAGESISAYSRLFLLYQLAFLVVGIGYSLFIVALSLWSVMSSDRPTTAIPLALLISCLLSPIWPLLSQQSSEAFARQTLVTFSQTAVVIGSLLVFRADGYRLLARR